MIEEKAKQFVDYMFEAGNFDQALADLRQLGLAEMAASTNMKLAEYGPGFYQFSKRLREITSPGFFYRLKRKFGVRSADAELLDLDNGICVLQHCMQDMIQRRKEIERHDKRLRKMLYIAKTIYDLVEQRTSHNVGSTIATIEAGYRVKSLTTHIVVLTQAFLAVETLIQTTSALLDAAHRMMHTHRLALRVNEQVKNNVELYQIPQNNAPALESGASERRPTHYVPGYVLRARNSGYGEDGWREYYTVS